MMSISTSASDTISLETFLNKGAYKFGKIKFPEFSRPLKQFFPYDYNVKTSVFLVGHFILVIVFI